MRESKTVASGLLLLGVMFWGTTFVFVKDVVEVIDPYSFVCVRFVAASALLGLIFRERLRKLDAGTLWKATVSGAVLAASFLLQTASMKYTTASNCAFITGLCVVFVPAIVAVLDRRLPSIAQAASVVMGVVGLGLMTIDSRFAVNKGDVLVLLCAIGFGAQIVIVGRMKGGIDAGAFVVVQLVAVAVFTGAAGLVANGKIEVTDNRTVWWVLIYCATFATAYIYAVQSYYQKRISEITAVLIYSLEPLFAAIFAYIYLGERLPARAMAGGALIFIGMIVSDIKPKQK